MTQAHSPGPWKFQEHGIGTVYDATDCFVAVAFPVTGPVMEANARLIAAAPDLLKACEAIAEQLEALQPNNYALDFSRAAIAKANPNGECDRKLYIDSIVSKLLDTLADGGDCNWIGDKPICENCECEREAS